jgi:hypothetical protein
MILKKSKEAQELKLKQKPLSRHCKSETFKKIINFNIDYQYITNTPSKNLIKGLSNNNNRLTFAVRL